MRYEKMRKVIGCESEEDQSGPALREIGSSLTGRKAG